MVQESATFSPQVFVCVMKSKEGELQAVAGVGSDDFVPLFEVPASSRAVRVADSWMTGEVLWVQPVNIDGHADSVWAQQITDMFDTFVANQHAAVPVVLTDEVQDSVNAYAAIIAANPARGMVLRLQADEIVMQSNAQVARDVDATLALYGLTPDACDLVIDAALIRDSVASRVAMVESALQAVPHLQTWRNVVIALSAFPDNMGAQAPRSAVTHFPREDREAFVTLTNRGLPRQCNYADFGVGQPTYGGAPYTPIPSIKYTTTNSWVVHRGAQKSDPSPQYLALAAQVTGSAEFRGAVFSAGDEYIAGRSAAPGNPGNSTKYLFAAMSHHINHVLDSLASNGTP